MKTNNLVTQLSKSTLLILMAVAALAACGKKEAEPAQTALPNPNTSNQEMAKAAGDVLKQISPQAAQQPTSSSEANLPSAERGKSLSDYQPLKSGVQLAYLYYALSGLPVDDERLAGIISADYRSTSDSFKKADILKVLKPQMEQQIADLRKNPYLKLHVEGAQLGHYDMSAKSFPIEGLPLAPDAYMSFRRRRGLLCSLWGNLFQDVASGRDFAQQTGAAVGRVCVRLVGNPQGCPSACPHGPEGCPQISGPAGARGLASTVKPSRERRTQNRTG